MLYVTFGLKLKHLLSLVDHLLKRKILLKEF